jgi:hypothetical protein
MELQNSPHPLSHPKKVLCSTLVLYTLSGFDVGAIFLNALRSFIHRFDMFGVRERDPLTGFSLSSFMVGTQ